MAIPSIDEVISGQFRFLGQHLSTTVGQFTGTREEKYRLDPPYQRPDVWTIEQRENLIRSVFAGIPIPPVIVNYRQGQGIYNVIDGRQRLTTICMFMHDKLVVDGYKFSTMPQAVQRQFENAALPCIECRFKTEAEEEVYYNVFNYSGTVHQH